MGASDKDFQDSEEDLLTIKFHSSLKSHLVKLMKDMYVPSYTQFSNFKMDTNEYDSILLKHLSKYLGNDSKFVNLDDFFNSFSNEDYLNILKMIFTDPKFKNLRNDYWDYFGEKVREWPDQLVDMLEFSNIKWDNRVKQFIRVSDSKEITIKSDTSQIVFIQANFEDAYFEKLKMEINAAFNANLSNAVYCLSRKLLENIVIDLLRHKFPNEIDIYYNPSKRRFLDFSDLIINLEKRKAFFGPEEKSIEGACRELSKFKETANSSVHSIDIVVSNDDLKSSKINDIVLKLQRISKFHGKGG